jgi:hypothetical protein
MTTQNPFDWSKATENVLGEMLELNPAAAYYSYGEDWGAPSQQKHYQNQFQSVYSQYLGSLGGLLRNEIMPTATEDTFANFLGDYDWSDKYTSQPPQMRGDFSSQFNPRTREIYF